MLASNQCQLANTQQLYSMSNGQMQGAFLVRHVLVNPMYLHAYPLADLCPPLLETCVTSSSGPTPVVKKRGKAVEALPETHEVTTRTACLTLRLDSCILVHMLSLHEAANNWFTCSRNLHWGLAFQQH